MQTKITPTMLNSRTRSHSALGVLGVLALSLVAPSAHAQRPSFGGLFNQVQDMLVGGEPFQTVAFGDGQCSIGIDPTGALTGLVEYDPVGFRLMGDGGTSGRRLLFGPTMDCTIEVQPTIPGLLLRDPIIRILPPIQIPPLPPILSFGPTDDCRILANPIAGGMIFQDPNGFRFENLRGIPAVDIPRGFIRFGDACVFGIDLDFPGVILTDPDGFRLLGVEDGRGSVLTFGPTDLCRILIDPKERPFDGLILTDPIRFTFESPLGAGEAMVDVSGTVAATRFVQESSRRLKENIRPIDNALETVKKLRGVRFDWKKEARASGGADLGFVAEEVAEVVSEAAVYDEENQATGVNYANLVALAVEGIKAQQEQIETQQKLITELQKEVAALRSGR
jgi:hypothetical protein